MIQREAAIRYHVGTQRRHLRLQRGVELLELHRELARALVQDRGSGVGRDGFEAGIEGGARLPHLLEDLGFFADDLTATVRALDVAQAGVEQTREKLVLSACAELGLQLWGPGVVLAERVDGGLGELFGLIVLPLRLGQAGQLEEHLARPDRRLRGRVRLQSLGGEEEGPQRRLRPLELARGPRALGQGNQSRRCRIR